MRSLDGTIEDMLRDAEHYAVACLSKGAHKKKLLESAELGRRLYESTKLPELAHYRRIMQEINEEERAAALLAGLTVGLRLREVASGEANQALRNYCEIELEECIL